MRNRRKHERFAPAADYKLTLFIDDVVLKVRPDNVSQGGAFLRPGVLFPLGATLKVELGWHGGSVKVPARVVRRDKNGIALEFAGYS